MTFVGEQRSFNDGSAMRIVLAVGQLSYLHSHGRCIPMDTAYKWSFSNAYDNELLRMQIKRGKQKPDSTEERERPAWKRA